MKASLPGVRQIHVHLSELLSDLGASSGEIASSLQQAGISGIPRYTEECAIAIYLHAVLTADARIRSLKVWNDRISVKPNRWWYPRLNVRLSQPLRDFISDFDRLRYPGLIRPAVVWGPRAPSTPAGGRLTAH